MKWLKHCVSFIVNNGINTVKKGCLLGKWTDELKGGYYEKFVSTGPKSHADLGINAKSWFLVFPYTYWLFF